MDEEQGKNHDKQGRRGKEQGGREGRHITVRGLVVWSGLGQDWIRLRARLTPQLPLLLWLED